ncbi:MAG: TetR/AcrR family transcriptional regulator [Solirubrobacteraceae bacterium]
MGNARLTREQSKAQTRERLLSAARVVFARRGFHGASVEEIAAEAGFSTGALYSNFEGKEDLFLALMDHVIDAYAAEISAVLDGRSTIADRAHDGARHWMEIVEREPEMLMLFVEFWAYAARDPTARERVAASFARVRLLLTRLVADGARELDLELAMPAEQLAIAIDALADGIARQKLADPDAIPDDLMGRVLALLLSGAARPATT